MNHIGKELHDLQALLAFHALRDTGSLRDAQKLLGWSRPRVRDALDRLGTELGHSVYEAHQRSGMQLTDYGRELLERTDVSVSNLRETWMRFSTTSGRRSVRVAATGIAVQHLLPRIAESLRGVAPQLRLHVTRASSSEVARQVATGRAELGIARDPEIEAAESRVDRDLLRHLVIDRFLDSELVIALPRNHQGARNPEGINREVGWIMPQRGRVRRLLGGAIQAELNIIAEVTTHEDALEWTAAGVAACLASSHSVMARAGDVSVALLNIPKEMRFFPLAVLRSRDGLRPEAAQVRDILVEDRCYSSHSAATIVSRMAGGEVDVLVLDDPEGATVLPKGGVEPDEDPHHAAVREVREESGLGSVELVAPLGDVRHRDPEGHLKRVDYYLAITHDPNSALTPDAAHSSATWRRLREWRSWPLKYDEDALVLSRAEQILMD